MSTLTDIVDRQRQQVLAHVDRLPGLAEAIGASDAPQTVAQVGEEYEFLLRTLIPRMASVEATMYAELDRLLSCRLGMTPLEREHDEIRALLIRLGRAHERLVDGCRGEADRAEVAAILRSLHALIEPHLREESRYVPILEHNLGPNECSAIAAAVTGSRA